MPDNRDKVNVMTSIVLRNGVKYGNIKYMIRDMILVDDYAIDSANQVSTSQVLQSYLGKKQPAPAPVDISAITEAVKVGIQEGVKLATVSK
jgi:hypothetical protein|tara:strand:- start:266 stop:538 length:273 start_codon:yes stop_codon:yes gene_type:complete